MRGGTLQGCTGHLPAPRLPGPAPAGSRAGTRAGGDLSSTAALCALPERLPGEMRFTRLTRLRGSHGDTAEFTCLSGGSRVFGHLYLTPRPARDFRFYFLSAPGPVCFIC